MDRSYKYTGKDCESFKNGKTYKLVGIGDTTGVLIGEHSWLVGVAFWSLNCGSEWKLVPTTNPERVPES